MQAVSTFIISAAVGQFRVFMKALAEESQLLFVTLLTARFWCFYSTCSLVTPHAPRPNSSKRFTAQRYHGTFYCLFTSLFSIPYQNELKAKVNLQILKYDSINNIAAYHARNPMYSMQVLHSLQQFSSFQYLMSFFRDKNCACLLHGPAL